MNYSINPVMWLALFFSLLVHFLIFQYKQPLEIKSMAVKEQHVMTIVRLQSLHPIIEPVVEPVIKPVVEPVVEQETEVEPIIKTEVVVEPEPIVESETIIEPEPIIASIPKPVVKKIIKNKTKAKKKLKPKKKPKEKLKLVTKPRQQVQPKLSPIPRPPVETKSVPSPEIIIQLKQSYQALLLKHIEVHKIYPKVARRRGLEGKVLVSFELLANGQIRNIVINHKQSILVKASYQAIDNALPMPNIPEQLKLPMAFTFYMEYSLMR